MIRRTLLGTLLLITVVPFAPAQPAPTAVGSRVVAACATVAGAIRRRTVATMTTAIAGAHVVRDESFVVKDKSGGDLFTFDWWQLSKR